MKKQILPLVILPFILSSCYFYNVKKEISYGEYGERNLLDIAFPRNKEAASLIVFIHGGGWIGGSKSNYAESYSKKYSDGYVYAAINYRYVNEEFHCNDILIDIQKAMLKIKDVCKENNYNINKVAFFGHSAGGHLSLLYAYKMRDVCPFNIGFVSSLAGPTDLSDEKYITESAIGDSYYDLAGFMTGLIIDANSFKDCKEALLEVSPINYVNQACPTIICHGDKDEIVPYSNAKTLNDKLEGAHIKHDFFTFTDSGHGLDKSEDVNKKYEEKFKEYKNNYL